MKSIYLVTAVFIFLRSMLSAAEFAVVTSFEDRLSRLEKESGIAPQPETTTVFFFGEFLYWKTSLDGVAYATTAKLETLPSLGVVLNDFKTRTVHFDYTPAFRVGFGVGLPHDHWDITALWMRSFTTGRDTAHGDLFGPKIIVDLIGLIEPLATPINEAKAKCHVHFDIVDLVLGRTFVWSDYFWFRPFGGVRGAWLRIDWDIDFLAPIVIPGSLSQGFTFFDVKNHYNAGGFVGGFETKWDFYKGLGLFSRATASLTFGKSFERSKQELFNIPARETTVFEETLRARNSTHAVKGSFDVTLGVKWEWNFYKMNQLLIWAGYEFNYWPNVTQKTISQTVRSRDRADLSYEGLNVGARFEF